VSLATADVREFVLDHLATGLAAKELPADTIDDDFDFLVEGVIDSFGLVELIGAVEERFGVSLDFEDVDADELTLFGPFCRYIAERSVNGHAVRAAPSPAAPPQTTRPTVLTPPTVARARPATGVRRGFGRTAHALHRNVVRARDKAFSVASSGAFHSFGARTVIQLPARIDHPKRMAIGSNGFIGGGSWLHALPGHGDRPAIEIGDGVSIAGLCVLSAARSIRIGKDVSLARNVYISDHTHVYEDAGVPVLAQGITDPKPVEIGDDAWIGENVMVFPGVRIGRGAVVGGNSIVSSDVPDYCLALGAPARVVRRLDGPSAG
jgi:acetyltransferase-like isoleucine patch superfamily enzyme/acyl carrier protein